MFAIAITLLVLELEVPQDNDLPGRLHTELIDQWPMYLAFLASFANIGIIWLNHHRLFKQIRHVTQALILLNTLLLLGITVVPFPTAVIAENLRDPANARTAALFYSGWFVVISLAFYVLWRYAWRRTGLIAASTDPATLDAEYRQHRLGPLLYVLAWVAAWFDVRLSIGINLGLALFFALPPGKRKGAS